MEMLNITDDYDSLTNCADNEINYYIVLRKTLFSIPGFVLLLSPMGLLNTQILNI